MCLLLFFLKNDFAESLSIFFFFNEALFILPITCFSSFCFYWTCSVWLFFRSAFLNIVLLFPHVVFIPFIFFSEFNFSVIYLVLLPQVLGNANSSFASLLDFFFFVFCDFWLTTKFLFYFFFGNGIRTGIQKRPSWVIVDLFLWVFLS